MSRLRSERSLLLHQVQELSRQTLERAEGVKRYFASSLREKDALLSHTKEQLQLQTEAATAKGQEVKELRHALQELRNTHSQREQDWAGQVQDLQTQLSKFTSEREREVAKDLADARDKMERLEKECKVLRGERDRGEVKLKAKERDVLTLQNTVSALREEMGKKDKQLEELQRDRRESDKEKEGLRLRLGELEAQMQALLLHQQQQSAHNDHDTENSNSNVNNHRDSAVAPAPTPNELPAPAPAASQPILHSGTYGSRKEVAGLQLQRLLGMYEKLMMGDE